MSDSVNYDRDGILRILKDLEMIVPSLDRIGSMASDTPPEAIARILDDFITDWDVSRKLAAARRYLSEPFDHDELEKVMDDVPHWRSTSREPPGGAPMHSSVPIIGRYTDREVELAGSPSALDALASIVSSATSRINIELQSSSECADPYDRFLEWIEVIPSEGLLIVEREIDRLILRGDSTAMRSLADDVRTLYMRTEQRRDRHLRIEPSERYAYVGSTSASVVFALH